MDFLWGKENISYQSKMYVYEMISLFFWTFTVNQFYLCATTFCEIHENLIVANISRHEADIACSWSIAKHTHHEPVWRIIKLSSCK
jgi:hypothetical protein